MGPRKYFAIFCTRLLFTRKGIQVTLLVLLCYLAYNYYSRGKSWIKLDPPGVIIHTVGGLGNQLFIYACSYSLAKHLNVPLYLEAPTNVFDPQSETFYQTSARPFVLHKFGVVYDTLVQDWYTSYWPFSYPVLNLRDHDLVNYYASLGQENRDPFPENRLLLVDDYCQSEHFFRNHSNEIREMFQLHLFPEELDRPPLWKWIQIINASDESVGVHVRRGDYGGLAAHGETNIWFTPISFYARGMRLMLEKLGSKNVTFFVFSDDMPAVKEEFESGISLLPPNVMLHFVSCSKCTTSLEDFYLMTRTRHMITGSSTYSWWAAWLVSNPEKVIIAPKIHPKTLSEEYGEAENAFKRWELKIFYPDEWIVLDPFS